MYKYEYFNSVFRNVLGSEFRNSCFRISHNFSKFHSSILRNVGDTR